MNKISILDATLRDGGYCNEWKFKEEHTKRILRDLAASGVDIVECGYLSERHEKAKDSTIFTSVEEINEVLPDDKKNAKYVCMINYGEYDAEKIPEYKEGGLDGFRVAFHKKDAKAAVEYCAKLQNKGYKIFVQPMATLFYSDEELLNLIKEVNDLRPYAFYMVDSFGMMKNKDVLRLFFIIEHNLDKNVVIGFHAHNNLQLAYSNARLLAETITDRRLIIDGCIFGMGRGAGNLNTELYVEYLNETRHTDYKSVYLFRIIDEILMPIYNGNYWGFSLPYYLSANNGCHSNYASFLDDRKTLTIENIDCIMKRIPREKKECFDEKFVQQLYFDFMTCDKVYEEHDKKFETQVAGKTILLIAPGRSILNQRACIEKCIQVEKPLVVTINFWESYIDADYVFVSNIRRFKEIINHNQYRLITTSNIESDDVYLKLNYSSYLVEDERVRDNAGLMFISFLTQKHVKKILLAGFDGFSADVEHNYFDSDMSQLVNRKIMKQTNDGLSEMIRKFKQIVPIEFVTTSNIDI